jgi:hypothetical protein
MFGAWSAYMLSAVTFCWFAPFWFESLPVIPVRLGAPIPHGRRRLGCSLAEYAIELDLGALRAGVVLKPKP